MRQRVRIGIVIAALVVSSGLVGFPLGAAESNRIAVVCPAIQKDDERRTNYPGEPERTIELIVRGKVTKTEEGKSGDNLFEMRVDEVLYGSWPSRTIRFSWPWAYAEKQQIIALVSNPYGEPAPWIYKYGLDATPDMLRGARALAEARLAYNVLSARCIFLGKDVDLVRGERHDYLSGYLRRVDVLRVISGEEFVKDKQVTALVWGFIQHGGESALLNKEPHIYVIGGIGPDKEKGGLHYAVHTMLGAGAEEAVRRALTGQEKYPVRRAVHNGQAIEYREIVFLGTPAEAVAMLKLPSPAAVLLAVRTMAAKPEPHRPLVIAEIEKELFRFTPQKDNEFTPLQNLVHALAAIEATQETAALERLVDMVLTHIESNKDLPADITRPAPARWRNILMSEESRHDVNHCLAWLVDQLDPAMVRKRFGARLLKLESAAPGNWRKEVNLAGEVCQLHDGYEVDRASLPMAGIKPQRSETGRFRRVTDLHLSADGKHIRTLADNNLACLWDAQTLKPIATQKLPDRWKVVSLRPWDGKYAIVFDDWNPNSSSVEMEMGRGKLISVDMDSGKKLADLPGKMSFIAFRVHWVNEHDAMHSDERTEEEPFHRYDYFTGRATAKPSRVEGGWMYVAHGHLTEDGKTIFLTRPGDTEATGCVESVDLATGKLRVVGDFKLPAQTGSKNGLVPGGQFFYLADPGVYIFDRATLKPVSTKPIRYRDLLSISFSGNGERYAIVTADRVYRGPRNEVEEIDEIMTSGVRPAGKPLDQASERSPTTVRIHETQTGQTLFAFPARTPWASATLSRDGNTVYLCNDDGTIEVWHLP